MTQVCDLATIDLIAAERDGKLLELYRECRDGPGFFRFDASVAVFRYGAVDRLLKHPRTKVTFNSPDAQLSDYAKAQLESHVGSKSGSEHRRLRSFVSRSLTTAGMARLEQLMRDLFAELIVPCLDQPMDFMDVVGNVYPATVVCHLLGIPVVDAPALMTWSSMSAAHFDLARVNERSEEVDEGLHRLEDYFVEYHRAAPATPRGLLDELRHVRDTTDQLSDQELIMWSWVLFRGGVNNTRLQLGSAVQLLATHHSQWEVIRNGDTPVRNAVEESMRFAPVGPVMHYGVREDLVIDAVELPAETGLLLMVGSANRDEAVFGDPEVFDVTRPVIPHLLFGGGLHFCIGNLLARQELTIALEVLRTRCVRLELAGEPTMLPPLDAAGPIALPIVLASR